MKMNDYERRWDNDNRRWVYKHREVMEEYIGRKLNSDEHIHHIDEDPKNNSISNLKIVTISEHAKIHKPSKYRVRGKCTVVGCDNTHHAKGMCNTHYMRELRKLNKIV